jgi:hypothetical protein
MDRPSWCQDPTCQPISPDVGARSNDPAISGFCTGCLPEPIVTERHGFRHVNNCHFCFRSAIRGVVMLEVNNTDLEIISRTAIRGLVHLDPERDFNWRWFTGRDKEMRKAT